MNQNTKNGRRARRLLALPVTVCRPNMKRSATIAWCVTTSKPSISHRRSKIQRQHLHHSSALFRWNSPFTFLAPQSACPPTTKTKRHTAHSRSDKRDVPPELIRDAHPRTSNPSPLNTSPPKNKSKKRKTHLKIYSLAWKINARSIEHVWRFSACSRPSAASHAATANCALSASPARASLRMRIHPCHSRNARSCSAQIVSFAEYRGAGICAGERATDSPEKSSAYCALSTKHKIS